MKSRYVYSNILTLDGLTSATAIKFCFLSFCAKPTCLVFASEQSSTAKYDVTLLIWNRARSSSILIFGNASLG